MSLALESRGLIKKRSYSALQCNVPLSEPGSYGVSPMGIVCTLLLWLSCFCLQSSCLLWLSLPVAGRVWFPVLLVSQSGAAFGLSWVRPGIFQNCRSTALQGTLPVLSHEEFLLVSGACSQTRYLPPAHSSGHKIACVVLFPFPQGRSPSAVVLTPVRAACILLCLWRCFGSNLQGQVGGWDHRRV